MERTLQTIFNPSRIVGWASAALALTSVSAGAAEQLTPVLGKDATCYRRVQVIPAYKGDITLNIRKMPAYPQKGGAASDDIQGALINGDLVEEKPSGRAGWSLIEDRLGRRGYVGTKHLSAECVPDAARCRMVFEGSKDPNGHYFPETLINGMPVTLMHDTGAYMVVLTWKDGVNAGVVPSSPDQIAEAATRIKLAEGHATVFKREALALTFQSAKGPVTFSNVKVLVAKPDQLHQSLLGNNVLQSLRVQRSDGVMQLFFCPKGGAEPIDGRGPRERMTVARR